MRRVRVIIVISERTLGAGANAKERGRSAGLLLTVMCECEGSAMLIIREYDWKLFVWLGYFCCFVLQRSCYLCW